MRRLNLSLPTSGYGNQADDVFYEQYCHLRKQHEQVVSTENVQKAELMYNTRQSRRFTSQTISASVSVVAEVPRTTVDDLQRSQTKANESPTTGMLAE